MYGLDAERSEQFVAAALAEWGEKRFLGGPLPAPDAGPTASAATPQRTQPPWRQTGVLEQRHYRILSSRFCLRFSSDAQARIVHPVVEHLEVRESSPDETVVDILETADRLIVYRDREFFADCSGVAELAPIVKSLVWVTAVNDHRFFLNIHAGVIGDQSRCILLPAPPGSGKSTLTASLVHAGFEYFSDEVALLEEGSFDVFPVPLAICVKAPASTRSPTGSLVCADCQCTSGATASGLSTCRRRPKAVRQATNRAPSPPSSFRATRWGQRPHWFRFRSSMRSSFRWTSAWSSPRLSTPPRSKRWSNGSPGPLVTV